MPEVPAAPARRRWRPRITVRMLMILVLLCGGIGPYANGIRVQRTAVRAIEKSGGRVVYDWEWKPNVDWKPGSEREERPELAGWRRWVAGRLGPDAVASVMAVALRNPAANDEVMAHVGRLWSLRELQLEWASVTDAGMAPIEQLTNLQILSLIHDVRDKPTYGGRSFKYIRNHRGLRRLFTIGIEASDEDLAYLANLAGLEFLQISRSNPPITDAGLAHLRNLTRMKGLGLPKSEITSAGLEQLKEMADLEGLTIPSPGLTDLSTVVHFPKLERLWISGSGVDDRGVVPLAQASGLSNLILDGTQITDAGIASLRDVPSLESLSLDGTQVTDAGLALLRDLPNLKGLSFAGTAITDVGMKGLIDFPALKNLKITGSKVTKAGIADFREVRPFIPIYN